MKRPRSIHEAWSIFTHEECRTASTDKVSDGTPAALWNENTTQTILVKGDLVFEYPAEPQHDSETSWSIEQQQ